MLLNERVRYALGLTSRGLVNDVIEKEELDRERMKWSSLVFVNLSSEFASVVEE